MATTRLLTPDDLDAMRYDIGEFNRRLDEYRNAPGWTARFRFVIDPGLGLGEWRCVLSVVASHTSQGSPSHEFPVTRTFGNTPQDALDAALSRIEGLGRADVVLAGYDE